VSLLHERLDLVGVKPLPVRTVRGNNDRRGTIAEALDDLERSRVGRNVPDLMSDAEVREALDRQLAREAGRNRKNSDQ